MVDANRGLDGMGKRVHAVSQNTAWTSPQVQYSDGAAEAPHQLLDQNLEIGKAVAHRFRCALRMKEHVPCAPGRIRRSVARLDPVHDQEIAGISIRLGQPMPLQRLAQILRSERAPEIMDV